MATVVANMSMSLDGFVADRQDQVGPLFDWYQADTTALGEATTLVGALICGRRLFDLTNAWGGRHPIGRPVVVVTHSIPEGWPRPGAPFTFVTDGVERAVAEARAIAGDRIVAVATPTITQQCLDLGLLDVIRVDLVPVLLGDGVPFFAKLRDTPILLEDPEVTEGKRVTHLEYRVRR